MAFDSFSDSEIREIYKLKKSDWSIRQIVDAFDSSIGTISRILNPETDEQHDRVDRALRGQGNIAPHHSNGVETSKPAPPSLSSIPESARPVFSRKNPSQTTVPANSPNAYQCSRCRDQFNLPRWHPDKYICPEWLKAFHARSAPR
jgi:hypothetical protein